VWTFCFRRFFPIRTAAHYNWLGKWLICCITYLDRLRLVKSLFSTNDVLLGCLFHVRGMCESAAQGADYSSIRRSGISLVAIDRTTTMTLAQFEEYQRRQRQLVESQLNALWDKVVGLVWESCAVLTSRDVAIFSACVYQLCFVYAFSWIVFLTVSLVLCPALSLVRCVVLCLVLWVAHRSNVWSY